MAQKQYTDEEILAYKSKPASDVHVRYADWLIEKLDLEFPNLKAEAAFREAVRLATVLRSIFQASPENQEVRAERKAERLEAAQERATEAKAAAVKKSKPAKDEEPKPAKGKAKATKPNLKVVENAADEDADADDTATTQAPAKKSAPRRASRSGSQAPF